MHWIALQAAPEGGAQAVPGAPPAGPPDAQPDALPGSLPDAATALAWWALGFTPLVAQVEQSLVLEVSGSERLFGGRAALLERLLHGAACPLPGLAHAQGGSARLALGRLWAGQPQAAIDTLPLHALAAARPHLPTLQRLGCERWGQLRALPRGGLARRFGAELLEALDQAYGTRPETFAWLRLPQRFEAALELSAGVDSAPALLFGARRLLAQLQAWLRARQHGVLALELLWVLDARRSNALHRDAHHAGDGQGRLVLRTAQATQDMQHLQRLLAEQLERVSLPAPVHTLRLCSLQTQPLALESRSLLPEEQRTGDGLQQVLERLVARLGPAQVLQVRPRASHQPECMQAWQPWDAQAPPARPDAALPPVAQGALLPGWLLRAPLPLALGPQGPQYQGALTLLAGPQRLETGWLEEEAVLRDYFVARSEQAGLLWIYREYRGAGAALRWFLHGLFA